MNFRDYLNENLLKESLKIGTSVTIPMNLTTDPHNKKGETGKITSIDSDVASIKFKDGKIGKYKIDIFKK